MARSSTFLSSSKVRKRAVHRRTTSSTVPINSPVALIRWYTCTMKLSAVASLILDERIQYARPTYGWLTDFRHVVTAVYGGLKWNNSKKGARRNRPGLSPRC